MILACTCKSEFQDKEHGRGMRVHNVNKDVSKARCSICLDVKSVRGQKAEEKK
jgi:hypothetical protein